MISRRNIQRNRRQDGYLLVTRLFLVVTAVEISRTLRFLYLYMELPSCMHRAEDSSMHLYGVYTSILNKQFSVRLQGKVCARACPRSLSLRALLLSRAHTRMHREASKIEKDHARFFSFLTASVLGSIIVCISSVCWLFSSPLHFLDLAHSFFIHSCLKVC